MVGSDPGESAIDSLLADVAKAPPVAPRLEAGTIVDGTFRVERLLGGGGMANVYLAQDVRLHRQVALKLHRTTGLASDERALREAKVMAGLSHPNIVTVHEVGTYEGQLFIAMEFLDGGTLRSWLRERTRGWREVLDAFVKAGRGLAAAHDAGLVHRDFKPDNVLVGADGRVRVADFGLARTVDLDDGREHAAGTPAYMAPEQRRGEPLDARADQYSFCIALREALERRGGGPRWLQRVIARGLEDDPSRRWPSMQSLIAQVERHFRRRRIALAAAGVALVATAASLLGWRLTRIETGWRWTGSFGHLILRTDPDGVTRGVYTHDHGTVVGRIRGGVFRGWWCEEPSRRPPRDAGELELTFVTSGTTRRINGRWKYGSEGDWTGIWDMEWVEGELDHALEARLNDPSRFCDHP